MRTPSTIVTSLLLFTGCVTSPEAPEPGPADNTLEHVEGGGYDYAYLEREGEGPVVVLIHGFPDTAHTWDDITAELNERGYRTIAPFLRGYPPTAIPGEDTDAETLGRDVIALLDALEIEEATIVGHDWGATAAYAAVNIEPTRFEGIVTLAIPHPIASFQHPELLAESPHFPRMAEPDAAAQIRAGEMAELDELVQLWSPDWRSPEAQWSEVLATLAGEGALEAALGYYRAFFAGLPPALILQPSAVEGLTIHGSNDGAGSQLPFADQAMGFTAPVEVVELPAGHFVHREQHERVVEELLAFLSR